MCVARMYVLNVPEIDKSKLWSVCCNVVLKLCLCDVGGGTILPATTRGPSRGRRGSTGTRGAGRTAPPALTGPHIHPGGDPSQATHFGSILPGTAVTPES